MAMKPFLTGGFVLLLTAGCSGGGAPAAFPVDSSGFAIPIYHLDPQQPEERPFVANRPFELEAPPGCLASARGFDTAEIEHENSVRLYGPGISMKRQTRM